MCVAVQIVAPRRENLRDAQIAKVMAIVILAAPVTTGAATSATHAAVARQVLLDPHHRRIVTLRRKVTVDLAITTANVCLACVAVQIVATQRENLPGAQIATVMAIAAPAALASH